MKLQFLALVVTAASALSIFVLSTWSSSSSIHVGLQIDHVVISSWENENVHLDGNAPKRKTVASSKIETFAEHQSKPRSSKENAFISMLCKCHNSTWDRPDGLGSEVTTIVHGKSIKDLNMNADNVLLVATGGHCLGFEDYELLDSLVEQYDRIITFDGSTRLEKLVLGWSEQPHLWLKLLAINMTSYKKVAWMGYDTIPYFDLANETFSCSPTPCIDATGNADYMVFSPDKDEIEKIYLELREHPEAYDGVGSYDNKFLGQWYAKRLTKLDKIFMGWRNPRGILHFTMAMKPHFQAYCRRMPPGTKLAVSNKSGKLPFETAMPESRKVSWCYEKLISNVFHLIFWRLLEGALAPSEWVRMKNEFGLGSALDDVDVHQQCDALFRNRNSVTSYLAPPLNKQGKTLKMWCPRSPSIE
mmetsp:Transcript_36909/g.59174  ORF Transcript_36909/g.59174 Transcript_36909/m.59174 type:complete len:416 (+) Transcript_36909:128-1375(+)